MSTYREYQRVIKLAISSPTAAKDTSALSVCADVDHPHHQHHTQDQLMDLSSRSDSNLSSVNSDSEVSDDSEKKTISKRKITRTKTGCFCCRKRKKKCDEIRPKCSGCVRNDLTCVYPSPNEIKKPISPSSSSKKQTTSINTKALVKSLSLESEKSKLESEFTNNTPPVSPNVDTVSEETEIKEYISPLTSPSLKPCSENYNHAQIRPISTFVSPKTTKTTTKSSFPVSPPSLPITFSNSSKYFPSSKSNPLGDSSNSSYQYLSELRSTSHLYPKQISIKSLLN